MCLLKDLISGHDIDILYNVTSSKNYILITTFNETSKMVYMFIYICFFV